MREGGVKKQEKVVTSFMDDPFQSSDLFDLDIFLCITYESKSLRTNKKGRWWLKRAIIVSTYSLNAPGPKLFCKYYVTINQHLKSLFPAVRIDLLFTF